MKIDQGRFVGRVWEARNAAEAAVKELSRHFVVSQRDRDALFAEALVESRGK